MELNKRKSLLTPASPTVWGMIHGDIDKQQDVVEMIKRVKEEVLDEISPIINNVVEHTQPRLEAGVNIKTFSGRSILGEGDMDPLDEGDRMLLETIETKADKVDVDAKADAVNTYTKKQVDNLLANVEVDTTNLATKEELTDLREGEIQTALMASDSARNIALSVRDQVSELRTYVDEQLTTIDTMTDDILG